MANETDHCKCGAPLTTKAGRAPGRGGNPGKLTEVRVCSDPGCATHDPTRRRIGDTR